MIDQMPQISLEGDEVRYLDFGKGPTVLFLHGWGLDHRAYVGVVRRMAQEGVRVLAPALPGFGGTDALPGDSHSFVGYAAWVHRFITQVVPTGTLAVVGHSFGGAVAIQFAHDFVDRVSSLLLVNSIGGAAWSDDGVPSSMAKRPWWDWGLHFPGDVWPIRQATRVLPVILSDAVANMFTNPRAYIRVAGLARRADMTSQLETLRDRGLPVTVLWGNRDGIVPRESFEAMCAALGTKGTVVQGSHTWIIGNPEAFGELITNDQRIAALVKRPQEISQTS
jgi:pimeloyl-ACP methyl ester carboxylesterase